MGPASSNPRWACVRAILSTKEVGEGTVAGLSIAMGIAEAHGGTLTLVPPSTGAWFRLAVPAADPAEGLPVASLVGAHRQ